VEYENVECYAPVIHRFLGGYEQVIHKQKIKKVVIEDLGRSRQRAPFVLVFPGAGPSRSPEPAVRRNSEGVSWSEAEADVFEAGFLRRGAVRESGDVYAAMAPETLE